MIGIEIKHGAFFLNAAVWAGLVQFVICVAISMQLFHANGSPYQFSHHFLSDLGRTTSPVCGLFNGSVFVLGMAVTAFFVLGGCELDEDEAVDSVFLAPLIRWSGAISGCGLLGIGLTPYDRLGGAHNLALGMWLAPMLVLLACYVVVGPSTPAGIVARRVAGCALLAICGYVGADFRSGYVVMQKVTVIAAVLWFLLIANPFSPVVRSTVRAWSDYRQSLEDAAADYLQRLEAQGHRRPDQGQRPKRRPDR